MIINKTIKRSLACLLALSFSICLTGCNNNQKPANTTPNPTGVIQKTTTDIIHNDTSTKEKMLYPAYTLINNKKKWRYINRESTFSIPPQYDHAEDFHEAGIAVVTVAGFYGVIDKSGNVIISPKNEYIQITEEGNIAVFKTGASCKLLDQKGKFLFEKEGFNGAFSDNRASFSKKNENEEEPIRYGYVDADGTEVIEPIYQVAYPFKNKKALVQIEDKQCALIDINGNIIKRYSYKIHEDISEDLLIYQEEETNLYGYLDLEGNIKIEAKFIEAQPFHEGAAIINASSDFFESQYGLIDRAGKFLIEPQYAGITYLEEGRYAVNQTTFCTGFDVFNKKAIFKSTGEQITEMIYYDISPFKNGKAFVSTDKKTYLLDAEGKINKGFSFEGVGSMTFSGDLFKAVTEEAVMYVTEDGKIVWKSEDAYHTKQGVVLEKKLYKPDIAMKISYPQVILHSDQKIQESINTTLKNLFVGDNPVSEMEEGAYTTSMEAGYSLQEVGELLVIEKNDYLYFLGAAHPNSMQTHYHMDVRTGKIYALKDLFKTNSDYLEKLKSIINVQIKKNWDSGENLFYEDHIEEVTEDRSFILGEDALEIYYQPYEIAPYVAGLPRFTIPYQELSDVINTSGDLWKKL